MKTFLLTANLAKQNSSVYMLPSTCAVFFACRKRNLNRKPDKISRKRAKPEKRSSHFAQNIVCIKNTPQARRIL